RHEVDAHLRRQLDGDGHHHRLQRAFRRGVVRVAGLAALSGGAADEDDVLQAGREQLAHQVESREHVDAKHLLERHRLDPADRAPVVDAGRVHEQVHLAELLAGGADSIDAALLGAEIGTHGERSGRRLVRPVVRRDARALRHPRLGDAAADAAGGAGDQPRPPRQVRGRRKHCPFFAHMVQLREVLAALIIFVATYLFLAGAELPFLKLDRPGGAVAGGVAMVALGVLTPAQVYRDAISWDTLVLLLGMMVITSVMARAGIFRWIAWIALRRAHGPRALLAVLVLVAGALSALLVNDTVCVMCTPLVVALVEAAALPALPYLLGLAFASNAGSVATLTGNPQNML